MTLSRARVTWHDIAAKRAADEGSKDGLLLAAEYILGAANVDAPYDTGRLVGSGGVDFATDGGNGEAMASVYYDTPYAVRVHQRPGGAWLRTATRKSKAAVLDHFAGALKLRFRRGSSRA